MTTTVPVPDNFDPDNMEGVPLVMAYAGPSGGLSSITAGPTVNGSYYTQTYTYTGADITGVSGWIKQG